MLLGQQSRILFSQLTKEYPDKSGRKLQNYWKNCIVTTQFYFHMLWLIPERRTISTVVWND